MHKRQLSLLHAVISGDNKCLQDVVQRQLACSFNNERSFFYMVAQVLEKYSLPTLSQLIASNIGKLQWKNMCKQVIESYWTKSYVDGIKTKKTLKYLSVRGLHVGRTHLVWQNLEPVSAVRKGVAKARFLTGIYILQSSRHVFSNRTVDPICRLCQLKVEDIHHVVTRYPAFHSIRTITINQLMNLQYSSRVFSISLPSQWVIKLSGWIKNFYPSVIPPISVETLQ